ncbi:MAG: hypothetical protein AABW41_02495 [Nanoarchaeota archaeon]
MKIVKETDFPLLQRKRYTVEINHDKKATPKNEELKKEISSFLKVSEDLISIRHIYTNYGETVSKIITNVYKTVEDLKKIEVKNKKPKKKKEKKAGKAPAK